MLYTTVRAHAFRTGVPWTPSKWVNGKPHVIYRWVNVRNVNPDRLSVIVAVRTTSSAAKSRVLNRNWTAKLLINERRDGDSTLASNGSNKTEWVFALISFAFLQCIYAEYGGMIVERTFNFNRVFGHANFCVSLLIGPRGFVCATQAHSIDAICCQTNYCLFVQRKMRGRHWTVCELCGIPFFRTLQFLFGVFRPFFIFSHFVIQRCVFDVKWLATSVYIEWQIYN